MRFSLRTLLLVGFLGPPVVAAIGYWVCTVPLTDSTLGIGLAVLFLFAAYDFVRGY